MQDIIHKWASFGFFWQSWGIIVGDLLKIQPLLYIYLIPMKKNTALLSNGVELTQSSDIYLVTLGNNLYFYILGGLELKWLFYIITSWGGCVYLFSPISIFYITQYEWKFSKQNKALSIYLDFSYYYYTCIFCLYFLHVKIKNHIR